MFTLWRKLEFAETAYFRPIANYSTNTFTNYNQIDVVKKDAVSVQPDRDAFEMALKSAINPLQVLNSLPSSPAEFRTISSDTVIHTLKTISTLQRSNKDSIKPDFITSHPNFEQLCRRLKRCSTTLTADDLVKSFRFLCSLGVPTNSEISLVLLNLIRHEINDLSVDKIIHLDFILSQTECRSDLQKAIQTALPIVFELQISQQIDKDNRVDELVRILNYFASHKGLDTKNGNLKIICKILFDKNDDITLPDAINIIHHLCEIDRFYLSNTIKLVATCIRKLMDQIRDIDMIELQRVINRLVSTTVNQFSPLQFHLHSLLNSCAERISQEDLGLNCAVKLQTTLKNISFQNTVLLKYIGDKLISDVENCKSISAFEVFTIIQAFANNLYTPSSTDGSNEIWSNRILPAISNNDNIKQIDPYKTSWLPFALQLVTLGHFNQELIARVLGTKYLNNYINRKATSALDLYKILILYQTVAMQPNINIDGIDATLIDTILKKYSNEMPSCDIQLDLIDHIGRACVLTNVCTKYMHLIPTLVKINQQTKHLERFPDDIIRNENGFIPLDAIPCEDNEVLVCVDSIKRYHLFSNVTSRRNIVGIQEISDEMKIGTFRLRRKQLEALGLALCEINYRRYKNIKLGKKFTYLQESIQQCSKSDA